MYLVPLLDFHKKKMSSGAADAAPFSVRVPSHAMGMLIGSGGRAFDELEQIPELTLCKLNQPSKVGGGTLQAAGSIRACVVVAERVADIINASYERNVRRASTGLSSVPGPQPRHRYEPSSGRPAARRYDHATSYRRPPSSGPVNKRPRHRSPTRSPEPNPPRHAPSDGEDAHLDNDD